jgi:hypothetical protein
VTPIGGKFKKMLTDHAVSFTKSKTTEARSDLFETNAVSRFFFTSPTVELVRLVIR